jgi:hypothetical protein
MVGALDSEAGHLAAIDAGIGAQATPGQQFFEGCTQLGKL